MRQHFGLKVNLELANISLANASVRVSHNYEMLHDIPSKWHT
jgi:hypothetical protein